MSSSGRVYLVGAGPGDPDLLTVKALRLIEQADVVVYDRLVSAAVLDRVPGGVTRICVGKAAGRHPVPQASINATLSRLALAGHRVVRLKGGDPFVFGRGGEEALHLAAMGIPFEVVPGITAAVASAAYAGIPVTHRGLANGVHFVAGHCCGAQALDLDWSALADPQRTVVFYMGLANLDAIASGLTGAGRGAQTPVAVVADGTLECQRRLLTTLARAAGDVRAAGIEPPAVIIVGEVVTLATRLTWFHPRPSHDTRDRHALALAPLQANHG